uniref:G protein-coupled receptor n=1 Tax=Acrobeloides nanus TaxID=290746 RepID=A0A914DSB1_9BILA
MPAMKDVILFEPSTSGCDVPTCGIVSVYLLGGQEGIAVLAIFASIFIIGSIYHRRVNYLKAHTTMSQTTMNLNRMLMTALIVHLGIIVAFLVVPVSVLYAFMIFGDENNNIILEAIVLVFSCHSLFDIPAMFFFIKPYRKFIGGRLRSALRKVGLDKFLKNDQVVMVQQVQSSMAINSSQITA